MHARHVAAAGLAWFLFAALAPAPAAGGWPLRTPGEVLLGYGDTWPSGHAVHRGVDLRAEPGDPVVAPEDASVAFCGTVPAGDATKLAVSLDLPDGSRLTLSPLGSAAVAEGDTLRAGASVGSLAAGGDPSHEAAHLHVSLRRNGAYLDPLTRLAPPAPPASRPDASSERVPEQPVAPGAGAVPSPASAAPEPATSPAGPPRVDVPARRAASVAAPASAPGAVVSLRPAASPASLGSAATLVASSRSQRLLATARAIRAADVPVDRTTPASRGVDLSSLAAGASRWATGAVCAVLAGLGLLWPVWRRETSERAEPVRPVGDDVAAAVGR